MQRVLRVGLEKLSPETFASRRLDGLAWRNFRLRMQRVHRVGLEKLSPQDATCASRRLGMKKFLPQEEAVVAVFVSPPFFVSIQTCIELAATARGAMRSCG
jgi:hypothetical protein